ncbi:MAG: ribosomal-processing cysteine protease Prp [Clostridia bacterium]|nr:ribosomal-processing cysteine protease Prp [Clostridia bacterium]
MTKAVFSDGFRSVRIGGHSGYAEEGADIVCAAVSSMATYFCNAAESFGAEAAVETDEEDGILSWKLLSPCPEAERLAEVLYRELRELEAQYPRFVRVIKSEKE